MRRVREANRGERGWRESKGEMKKVAEKEVVEENSS